MNLIVITGPTCSGKSEMAVELASFLKDSWIVNCDSRQVYKGMNIGTAKIPGEWRGGIFYYKNIPHFLIDHVDPKKEPSLADFLFDWCRLFEEKKDNLPKNVILSGGTGLYAKAVLEEMKILPLEGGLKKDFEKRKRVLNGLDLTELKEILFKINFEYKNKLNNSELNNPRRFVNFILKEEFKEVFEAKSGQENNLVFPKFEDKKAFYINISKEDLDLRIKNRVLERLEGGLVEESKKFLNELGVRKMQRFGLEYRLCTLFLLGQLTYLELQLLLIRENLKYAKRQITWFKKQGYIKIENLEGIFKNLF